MFPVVFPRLSAFGGQVDGINDAAPGTPALGADPVNAGNAEDAQGQNFSAMAARIANLQFQRQPVVDRAEEAAGFLTKALDGGAESRAGPRRWARQMGMREQGLC